jgi:flagellar biosynthesis anti-sigma factor FlgM
MRIGDTYSKVGGAPIPPPAIKTKSASRDEQSQGADASGSGDVKVSVSAKALALAQASNTVDDAKVARLTAAVKDGSLGIDSAKIASRIIDGE